MQPLTISATVSRVAYPPSTSAPAAWYILVLAVTGQTIRAVGRIPWRPQQGDNLTLTGAWGAYQGNRQFVFDSARLDIPTDPREQLNYVCARTLGAGPAMAKSIWQARGGAWQEIADGEIPRLSGKTFTAFQEQLQLLESRGREAQVVAYLMVRGCTDAMACAAWERWGGDTLGVVNSDPFRLAELEHYGFDDVDRSVRQHYGIQDDDPRRIRAAVLYAMGRLTAAGDTVVARKDLVMDARQRLRGCLEQIHEQIEALIADGVLQALPDCKGLALAADWQAEVEIWEWVNERTI